MICKDLSMGHCRVYPVLWWLPRNQLQTFYRKQSYSIDRAFQLLADHSAPPGLNTRHARAGPNELAERDPELVGSEEQDREAGAAGRRESDPEPRTTGWQRTG